MKSVLTRSIKDLQALLPRIEPLAPQLERLGDALLDCWKKNGKVLIAGNGGSAADAMHLAEELCVRFVKNRRALAAIALCDPTVLTCAPMILDLSRFFRGRLKHWEIPKMSLSR